MVTLPTAPIEATLKSPKNLIIFSKPKAGKTSLMAGLEGALIIDMEDGSDYVTAMKIKVKSVQELKEIGEEIKKQGSPYKYIAIDTITALEELCEPYAEILYSQTPMGSSWFKKDENGKWAKDGGKGKYGRLTALPNGGGWLYVREAFNKMLAYIDTLAPHIILLGHVKDSLLDKSGTEFSSVDLSLTGKMKQIATSQSDAIGYLYRKGNQNILSFKTSDQIACGARPEHLRNAEIVVSEMVDGKLVTHWDKVFLD